MRRAFVLIALAGLLLLASCGAPVLVEPTAIPLAATATTAPRPTSPPGSEAQPTATRTDAAPAATEAATTSPGIAGSLDAALARRTAEDWLARLVKGEAAAAFRLYVADEVRGELEQSALPVLTAASPKLGEATLLEITPADGGFQARGLLRWEDGSSREVGMRLTPDAGLWLITAITFGDQVASPTATARPAAARPAARQTTRPALTGRLAFQVSSGGPIYVVNADGSGLRQLTDGLDPAWSPDGERLAFTRWRNPWGVYTIQADGGGEERVVDGNQLKEVAWSPDGGRLAFTINYSSPGGEEICFFGFCFTLPPISVGQLWTANLESGEFLSLPLDDHAVHAPAWDPAQPRIVYAGDRGLAWIDLVGEMDKGLFPGGSAWDTSPAFSPDGQRIAYMGRVHNRWEIFVMNADGSGRAQLTRGDPDLDPAPSNVAPAWSPDGRSLAFLSNRDGPWRIYVMNADGSGQRSLFAADLDRLGIRYEWASERVVTWTR